MEPLKDAEKVDALLSELNQVAPIAYDLGTPEVIEVDATYELINMGSEIVPLLLERLESSQSKKTIAHIVLVLNNIGDSCALEPLINLCNRFQEVEIKDEWDFAIIGQCRVAIANLENSVE